MRAYNSTNFEDVLLSGDVWLAQGWNGQFAKAMDQDPDIVYVIPKEGATVFIDNLAIPADARHAELAHAFIDFTLEADVAAEICETMRYSSPNRAAWPKLSEPDPPEHRGLPAPRRARPPRAGARTSARRRSLYDELWTEVKSSR